MQQHLVVSLSSFFADEAKMTLVLLSFLLAAVVLFVSQRQTRSAQHRFVLLHLHLGFLLFPFAFLALSLTCTQTGLCAVGLTQMALLTLPLAVVAALFAGLFLLPLVHRLRGKPENGWMQDFVSNQSVRADVFLFDSLHRTAYSVSGFYPAILVSRRMASALSRKQMQAVLLHELAHIRRGSQPLKTVALFLQRISPLRRLVAVPLLIQQEEAFADGFAARVQGTSRHLEKARRKIS
jgi:Zn-dependent protease with chaperone function